MTLSKRVSFFIAAALFLLSAHAQAVIIGDEDWRQLTETVGFSYDDLVDSGTCNPTTGACSGTLTNAYVGTVDFTGWTWASVYEVGAMFEAVGIGPTGYFSTPNTFAEYDSTWAPAFVDTDGPGPDPGLFDETVAFISTNGEIVHLVGGMSSTSDYTDINLAPWIGEFDPGASTPDIAYTQVHVYADYASPAYGVWLYRSASVPEPMALVTLGVGLIGMGFARRARRTSSRRKC